MSSPYKKIKNHNSTYVQYTSCKELVPLKLYKVTNIIETKHEKYGQGFLAFINDHKRKSYKVQMPTKYLATLTIPDDIDFFKKDIASNKNPLLIFRDVLPNGSFRIDIIPKSSITEEYFKNNNDYPELDDLGSSLEEGDEKTGSEHDKSSGSKICLNDQENSQQ